MRTEPQEVIAIFTITLLAAASWHSYRPCLGSIPTHAVGVKDATIKTRNEDEVMILKNKNILEHTPHGILIHILQHTAPREFHGRGRGPRRVRFAPFFFFLEMRSFASPLQIPLYDDSKHGPCAHDDQEEQ